jgi:hypothetical protein
MEWRRKLTENLRIVGIPTEVRTEYPLNTSVEFYLLDSALRRCQYQDYTASDVRMADAE